MDGVERCEGQWKTKKLINPLVELRLRTISYHVHLRVNKIKTDTSLLRAS